MTNDVCYVCDRLKVSNPFEGKICGSGPVNGSSIEYILHNRRLFLSCYMYAVGGVGGYQLAGFLLQHIVIDHAKQMSDHTVELIFRLVPKAPSA